jgi:hypothetical protein
MLASIVLVLAIEPAPLDSFPAAGTRSASAGCSESDHGPDPA